MANLKQKNAAGITSILVPPTMPRAISVLLPEAQEVSLVHPSRFHLLEYARLVNRLLKVKEALSPLPECDLVLQIENGEKLHLHAGKDGA